MRKVLIAAALVLAGVLLLCGLSFYIIADGAYPLEVTVAVEGDPPKWVSCQTSHDERDAEWMSKQPKLYDDFERVVMVTPFEGQPIEVRVPYSYHGHAFGLKTDWSQHRYLVVMADWPDGRHMAKVVAIPDGQTIRTLRVELP